MTQQKRRKSFIILEGLYQQNGIFSKTNFLLTLKLDVISQIATKILAMHFLAMMASLSIYKQKFYLKGINVDFDKQQTTLIQQIRAGSYL